MTTTKQRITKELSKLVIKTVIILILKNSDLHDKSKRKDMQT